MSMPSRTDPELLRLVQLRRREALEALYDRYAKLVYSFALRSTRSETLAGDIVQQVFTRLWTTSARFDPDKGQFVNWLLTITRNITIDVLRKERKLAAIETVSHEKLDSLVVSEAETPEQAVVRGSIREGIKAAYKQLSAPQQQLIELFYWQGYTLSEIASSTGEPIGTLKSRLHMSLKTLRRLLQADREE